MSSPAVLKPDINGVFHSPIEERDWTKDTMDNMPDFFRQVFVDKFPNSSMIEPKSGNRITYKQCYDAAEKVSRQFARECLTDKIIVHIVGENSIRWCVAMLASHLSGFVVSSSHPVSPWPELERNIRTTCSTVLILTEECYNKFKDFINAPFLTAVYVMKDEVVNGNYNCTFERHDAVQTEIPVYNPDELVEIAEMLLSSGTSGVPKAVKISAKSIIYSINMLSAPGTEPMTEKSVYLVAQPMAHIGGQNVAFLGSAYRGPTLIITDYPGSIGLLQMTQDYKMTHILAVPPVLNFLAKYDDLENYDLSSVEYIITGATTINFESIETIIRRSGNPAIITKVLYGATESYGVVFGTNDLFQSHPQSIGVPFQSIRFRIENLEDQSVVIKPKIEGELVVKGELPFSLYFNDPVKSAEAETADGWYKTGDVVHLDEGNNLFITGRIKDIVKFRGFAISPAELEDVLLADEQVSDCSVVGKPSDEHGEIPVVFVVTQHESDELKERLVQLVKDNVAQHKCIHEVFFVEKIPRNPNGKTLKRVLRDTFSK